MMKAKILILMIIIVLFTIFVTQNTEVIPINFLFWTVELSKIVIISLTGLLGLIMGFIIAHLFDKPKKIKNKKQLDKKDENNILNNQKSF